MGFNNSHKYLLIALLFFWSAWVFFPGSYSVDSWSIFAEAIHNRTSDWYAPIIVCLWRALYGITSWFPSMYVFQLFFYWLFIALLLQGGNKSNKAFLTGMFAAIILLFIPQYVMKDSHLAIAWGIAASLFMLAANSVKYRKLIAYTGFIFLAYGLFARINMIVALLPLTYVFVEVVHGGSRGTFFKTVTTLFTWLMLFAANQFLNYNILGAHKAYPQYKLRLLDISGISIASGHNYMPACVTSYKDYSYDSIVKKYSPASFDEIYWPPDLKPIIPGPDSALNECVKGNWQMAVKEHPFIYLENRAEGFLYYLRIKRRFAKEGYWDAIIWIDNKNPMNISMQRNLFRNLLVSVYAPLSNTFIFAPWFWLLLNTAFFVYYIRKYRDDKTRTDRKLIAFIQLSGVLGILSQFPIYQHDRDFRYNYWNVFVFFIGCVYAAHKKKVKSVEQINHPA